MDNYITKVLQQVLLDEPPFSLYKEQFALLDQDPLYLYKEIKLHDFRKKYGYPKKLVGGKGYECLGILR